MSATSRRQFAQSNKGSGSPSKTYGRENIHSYNNDSRNLGSGTHPEDDGDEEDAFGNSERHGSQRDYSQNRIHDSSTSRPSPSARFRASPFETSPNRRELFPNHQNALHTPPSTSSGSQSSETPDGNIESPYSLNLITEQIKCDLVEMRTKLYALVDKSIQNITDKLPESYEQSPEMNTAMDWQHDPEVIIPQIEGTRCYQDVEGAYRGGEEADEGNGNMERISPLVLGTPEMGRRVSSERNHVVGS